MWNRGLNNKERVARLIGGGLITGIALSGGLKTIPGKDFIGTLGAAALFEGIVNEHLMEYLNIRKS
jgi:hypothetical protein